jgi:hypothetical protein
MSTPDPPRFQIVPLAPGERPASNAIASGAGLGPILAHLNGRADLDAAIGRAAAAETRTEAAIRDHNKALGAVLDTMSSHITDFETRLTGLRKSESKRRDLDDETRALRRFALPPEDSPLVAADDPAEETHGELTTHPPSHPHDKEQLQLDTATGATPRELERNVPPIGGSGTEPELDPAELAHPRVPKYRAPAALGLN